jgi:cytidylate kinase
MIEKARDAVREGDDGVARGVIARVHVAARARPRSTASRAEVERHCVRFVRDVKGGVDDARADAVIDGDESDWASESGVFLRAHCDRVCVHEVEWFGETRPGRLLAWQCEVRARAYELCEDEPGEEVAEGEEIATYREWNLPCVDFEGAWESLIFDDEETKSALSRYAAAALLFGDRGVDAQLISWNRVVLLHGPPGTGKTTMCKALAQRLSIRFNHLYSNSILVEVNAHSLFSRWFSESGKLVSKLFGKIQELLEDQETLVFVLVDEVESLAATRKSAANGAEPSDAIRVVNALLTQLDALKKWPNAVVLTTSNITEAIDVAFVDRADIKCYIGPPGERARYEILRSCVNELIRCDLVQGDFPLEYASTEGNDASDASCSLRQVAQACDGLSGRALRKLPFLAYSAVGSTGRCSVEHYVRAMLARAKSEIADRRRMEAASTAAA